MDPYYTINCLFRMTAALRSASMFIAESKTQCGQFMCYTERVNMSRGSKFQAKTDAGFDSHYILCGGFHVALTLAMCFFSEFMEHSGPELSEL